MRNIVDEDFSNFAGNEEPLIDWVVPHTHQGLFMGYSLHKSQAGAMTHPEQPVLRNRICHIAKRVEAEPVDSSRVHLFANNILIGPICYFQEVDYTIIESNHQLATGRLIADGNGFFGVAFAPYLYELVAAEVALPCLYAAHLHKLPLILPGHFGVCHPSIYLIHGALISSSYQEQILILQIHVVPNALGLALYRVLGVQLGRIYHHV